MLVDCRASTYILDHEPGFINFDKGFDSSRHIVELADGSKYNN